MMLGEMRKSFEIFDNGRHNSNENLQDLSRPL